MMSYHRAQLNGTLLDDGGEACDCGFEWGRTVAYGNIHGSWPVYTGEAFFHVVLNLLHNTTYHFRAFATNSLGTSYGIDRTFTTAPAGSYVCPYDGTVFGSWGELYIHLLTVHGGAGGGSLGIYICTHCGALFSTWDALYAHLSSVHGITSAQVLTRPATNVTGNSARVNGLVIEDLGVISEARFQYGLTTDYGINTPWRHGYAKGDSFFVDLVGLAEGTAFHFRAQMRNRGGIVSGADMTFNTLSPLGPVTLVSDEILHLLGAVA